MCKFIGKSNERILCKLNKSEILRLYSIVHVAMETTKTSHFTCHSKSFISIFFTCQVSACELQPFSCHDLANDIYHKLPKLCSATLNKERANTGFCSALVKQFVVSVQALLLILFVCKSCVCFVRTFVLNSTPIHFGSVAWAPF